ncbi:hypothetical protein RRG08_020863 [Elysia crispata]|uniref:Uncharacterized protein n=1 Tax=Elysia crispata TaxID=231223 RepID=A0AAE1CMU4_9GAST|nr:hypothetical protein RRG08_020863 [Elysia crispata]
MLKNDQRREEKMLELEAMDVGIEVAPSVGVLWEKLILGRQTTISEYHSRNLKQQQQCPSLDLQRFEFYLEMSAGSRSLSLTRLHGDLKFTCSVQFRPIPDNQMIMTNN